ncbi:MAG: sugar phosphate isomerase/epimerase [Alphaproteobacteria bacterium]|nr:sugar phosphate isomerase/epimerase [Alphaproteobacteria bacterium]
MKAPNAVGIISMFYARPFGPAHLSLFPRMKAAGMDFVELLVPEEGELDLARTRAALSEAGLGVALAARVNLQRDLASADAPAHRAGIAYLKRCVDVAVELGATLVGGPLYGAPLVFAGRPPAPVDEPTRAARIERIVAGLKDAAGYAASRGVVFGLEPLNRFETDIANTTRHGLAIVEAVDSPALGVMLDTFHMNMEDPDIAAALRRAGDRLVHFQANENDRGFVGSGHIDWPAVAKALAHIGYRGPITLEPFRRDDERPGVPLAQWRAPARDYDAELSASAAFLRATLDAAWRTR